MSEMRAKMVILGVEKVGDTIENIDFRAVCANEFGEDGSDENNTYAMWTPTAELSMTITNPDLIGKFEEGQEFYVDFTAVN